MAGRKCIICSHEHGKTINSALLNGASFRNVTERWPMGIGSVSRHVNSCLKLDSRTLQEQITTNQAIDHHAELTRLYQDALKYQAAANEYLTDPDNPSKFTLCPRTDELDIIYEILSNGEVIRVKRSLREVVDDINEKRPDWNIKTIVLKSSDIKEFALKAMDKSDMFLDKFARVQGLYKEKGANPHDAKINGILVTARTFANWQHTCESCGHQNTQTSVKEQLEAYLELHPDDPPAVREGLIRELGQIG